MDSQRSRLSDRTSLQPASIGLGNDLRRLKSNGAASLAELREFLGNMRGRSPQEVLGEVANSSLVQCTIWSTVGMFALIVVGTLLPYYISGPRVAPAAPVKAPTAAAPTQPAAPAPQSPNAGPAASGAPAAAGDTAQSNAEKAAEKMELNETKQSDPKKNPLEKDLDKLLEIKD